MARASASDEAVRAFVAAEPDARVRRAVDARVERLRRAPGGDAVRWVPAENLHVTLRFLGQVETRRLPGLARSLCDALAPLRSFSARLGALGAFPTARRPRVFVLGLEPEASFATLFAAVERGVVASGFAPDARRFRAHLTLGRVRPGRRPPPVTFPVTAVGESFEVTEAVLFRSDLDARGAVYTPLERMALGGESHP